MKRLNGFHILVALSLVSSQSTDQCEKPFDDAVGIINVIAESLSAHSIKLSWTSLQTSTSLQYYDVKMIRTDNYEAKRFITAQNELLVNGLEAGLKYTFTVRLHPRGAIVEGTTLSKGADLPIVTPKDNIRPIKLYELLKPAFEYCNAWLERNTDEIYIIQRLIVKSWLFCGLYALFFGILGYVLNVNTIVKMASVALHIFVGSLAVCCVLGLFGFIACFVLGTLLCLAYEGLTM